MQTSKFKSNFEDLWNEYYFLKSQISVYNLFDYNFFGQKGEKGILVIVVCGPC